MALADATRIAAATVEDAWLAGLAPPALLERVMSWLAEHAMPSPAECAVARTHYETQRARVHHDHPHWEAWSAAFVDWLLCEAGWPVASEKHPRIDSPGGIATGLAATYPRARTLAAACSAAMAPHAPLWSQALAACARSHRSLFLVERMAAGRIALLDLLGGAAFDVVEPRQLAGVELGDVAELRLIGWQQEVWLGRTFLYHPARAHAAIVERAQQLRRQGFVREAIIDDVAATLVARYPHLPVERAYALGGRARR